MRRLLMPPVAVLAGLMLALAGCSGESPTSPTGAGGGSGAGTCTVTISLDATSVTPLANSAVIVRATVKKGGAAVPDGTSVVFTTDFGFFVETGLPSVSKVTSSGFADVTLGSTVSGTSHVKATYDCGSATLGVEFGAIPVDGPYISSLSPLTGSCLGGDTVTINGGRFVTALNVQPRVTFGGSQGTVLAATASQIVVLTPARTLADASVPETVDLVVTVNAGTAAVQTALAKKFTYTCIGRRIAITSVNPNLGRQEGNEPVTIAGANFLPTSTAGPATTRVTFGGVTASITAQSDTTLNVTTPRHTLANAAVPETVDVVATVDLGLPTQQSASLLRSFTYYAAGAGTACGSDPRLYITQVVVSTPTSSPGSPDGGDVVTISGGGFWFGNTAQPSPISRVKVEFGGVQSQVTSWGDSAITVVTPRYTLTNPDAPLSVDVKVTVDVGGSREACIAAAKGYTYFPGSYAEAYITSMSPSTGPNDASTRVTIFGKNFRFPSQVFVGVAEATVVSISSTQIVFMSPTATGANAALAGTTQQVQVRDTYSGKTFVSPVNFRYYACPTTGTAAPATAAWNVSTPVTISGHAFEEPVEAVYQVNGLSFRVNVISVSSSAIIVQMPVLDQLVGTGNISCGDVAGSIVLTFPGLACAGTIPVPFTYQMNRPTIATVSPQTPIGQLAGNVTVTVSGSGFVDPMTVDVIGADGSTTRVSAVVSSTGTLSFLAPKLPNSAFLSEPCQPTGSLQLDGQRFVNTWMRVRLTNTRTQCTAELGNAILYTPSDVTCRAPLTANGAPAVISANLCSAVSGAIATFHVYGGIPAAAAPYYIVTANLPSFMTFTWVSPNLTVSGTGGMPTLSSFNPVDLAGQPTRTLPYSISVTDAVGANQTLNFNFTVFDSGAPMSASIPASQTIAAGGDGSAMSAAGGQGPYTWAISAPFTINASHQIHVPVATPSASYPVTVTVQDSLSCSPHHQISQAVTITVP